MAKVHQAETTVCPQLYLIGSRHNPGAAGSPARVVLGMEMHKVTKLL